MPELMEDALVFGFVSAVLCWVIGRHYGANQRMLFFGTALIAIAAAYLGPPALIWWEKVRGAIPFLPDVTGGMVFIGLFVAFVAHIIFERKDQPRRIPIWAVALIAVIAGLGFPPLIDRVTGTYQQSSFRQDVN